jgi:ureidoglycolate hydrolase
VKKAKAKKTAKTPSAFIAAGYKIVTYTNGTLLLQKGSDLRLFYLTVYREGGDPTNGRIEVSFAGKVP